MAWLEEVYNLGLVLRFQKPMPDPMLPSVYHDQDVALSYCSDTMHDAMLPAMIMDQASETVSKPPIQCFLS